MALKAGRVGVAPEQVDEFGQIKSEATSGYTKQEADAKFETKTAASAALAQKQPINLSLPVELLTGSALTVEAALQGIAGDNEAQQNNIVTLQGLAGDVYNRKLVGPNRAHTVHFGFSASYPFLFIIIGRDASWAGYMIINTEWNQTVNAIKVFENDAQDPISGTLTFTYVDATHFDISTTYTSGVRYLMMTSHYPTLSIE